jgi:hypothetical protein
MAIVLALKSIYILKYAVVDRFANVYPNLKPRPADAYSFP